MRSSDMCRLIFGLEEARYARKVGNANLRVSLLIILGRRPQSMKTNAISDHQGGLNTVQGRSRGRPPLPQFSFNTKT